MQPSLDLSWFQQHFTEAILNVSPLEDMSAAGGLSASMHRVTLTFQNPQVSPRRFVVKRTKPTDASASTARNLGTAREAFFFRELAQQLPQGTTPTVIFASGDLASGSRTIVMEEISGEEAVQLGHFFGPGSPLNWGKDLAVSTRGWDLSESRAVDLAFEAAARLHAEFWRGGALRGVAWLRGAEWLEGRGRESWLAAQGAFSGALDEVRSGAVGEGVKWDPRVLECLEAARKKTDWDVYQREVEERPWTLVHGDFHPANIMLMDKDEPRVVMLDFEMVGLGSGAQDLGQFMISHVRPQVRIEIERKAVESYHAKLCALNEDIKNSYSTAQCWADYVQGGIGRWLWFLPILARMCSSPMTQYFHDQVLAFLIDHKLDVTSIPMPRV